MKFKVFKVTPDEKRTLVYQFEVGEVQPGTSSDKVAVDYLLSHIAHKTKETGVTPLADYLGMHLTTWVVLDDTDIYWFIPGGRFKKQPTSIIVGP